MALHKTILDDLAQAMKSRDAEKLNVLRMVKAAFLNAEKETSGNAELSDEQVTSVLQKEAKKRKDSIAAFEQGGRADLVDQEKMELAIIESYLPAEFTDEEIQGIINEVTTGNENTNFGAVMGQVMQKVAGRADGNRVRELLQKQLNG